ncbi:hypothetical protein KSU13_09440 [Fusobacterium nucleatum]|uniref:hypothetical protein n=1 Tax=Fusobacterium nucleatum TaxID=851 RepID=UPI001237EDAB|nr:hypothetical protein [Fusobacterium nucleatum]
MFLDIKGIGKKDRQKQIRLSEKVNSYLAQISEKFEVSETDIVNILLNNIGNEIKFIDEIEEKLRIFKKENENISFKKNLKIISPLKFIGYYPLVGLINDFSTASGTIGLMAGVNTTESTNYTSAINKYAFENVDIFVEESIDKNYKYFIRYEKKISILDNPTSVPMMIYYFNDSRYTNDIYDEFKSRSLNISELQIDKNYT